jgi:hypothetical protein
VVKWIKFTTKVHKGLHEGSQRSISTGTELYRGEYFEAELQPNISKKNVGL